MEPSTATRVDGSQSPTRPKVYRLAHDVRLEGRRGIAGREVPGKPTATTGRAPGPRRAHPPGRPPAPGSSLQYRRIEVVCAARRRVLCLPHRLADTRQLPGRTNMADTASIGLKVQRQGHRDHRRRAGNRTGHRDRTAQSWAPRSRSATSTRRRVKESGAALGLDVYGKLDVTDPHSFSEFLDEVERQLGPIDVLVNNAGIMPRRPDRRRAGRRHPAHSGHQRLRRDPGQQAGGPAHGSPRIRTRHQRRLAGRGALRRRAGHLLRQQARGDRRSPTRPGSSTARPA